MQKFVNRIKLLKDYLQGNSFSSGLPIEMVIEATNKCNLNCTMCTRQKMKRPLGLMKMELYKKIIDEVSSYLELVYLHGLGEPLFHPRIFEMVAYAKSKGLTVGLSTNATLLNKEKSNKLIESKLDYLIIALDANTPETYFKVRGGKNFTQVTQNVKEYLKLKKKAKNSPFTVLQFVKTKENIKEVEGFKKTWEGKGADVVRLKPVIDLLKENKTNLKTSKPCFYLWRQLNMISWDGKIVTPCCMDTEGDYSLGDATKNSIAQLWNSPKMQSLRLAHLKGRSDKIALCRNCNYPQPVTIGKVGALVLPEVAIKKILPFLERLTYGKFIVYD